MKIIVNNRTDARKPGIKLFLITKRYKSQIHVSDCFILTIKISQWACKNFCSFCENNIVWTGYNTVSVMITSESLGELETQVMCLRGRLFCEPASPRLKLQASVYEPQKIPAKKSKNRHNALIWHSLHAGYFIYANNPRNFLSNRANQRESDSHNFNSFSEFLT